jgi:glycosyltransferase involved in cell wall biosynthesis
MKIVIVTDAWRPQVNGVVRTLEALARQLAALGHQPVFLSPEGFRSIPCPTYPEIRLVLGAGGRVGRILESHRPCAIHIATEGPLGLAARRYCVAKSVPFTTAYHTRFPEYVAARFGVPLGPVYAFLRWFHRPSTAIMVATPAIEDELRRRGFVNLKRWTRGVDLELFRPGDKGFLEGPRPIALYVGRVAVEKNIEAFLALDLAGTKYVVGDGPQLAKLRARHPEVRFTGAKTGDDLARHYAAADVFVFPSRTDTFGLVMLEALAAGVPVAAYPVPGPIDVIDGHGVGALDDDLGRAVERALAIDPAACRRFAETFGWSASAQQFLGNLSPFDPERIFGPEESLGLRQPA